jgi:Fe-S oxidoreductase
MPLVADQMSKRRLEEVKAAGGGMVVTSCATCAFMLKRNAPPSVEVANLATAMAQLSETPFTPPSSSPLDDEI